MNLPGDGGGAGRAITDARRHMDTAEEDPGRFGFDRAEFEPHLAEAASCRSRSSGADTLRGSVTPYVRGSHRAVSGRIRPLPVGCHGAGQNGAGQKKMPRLLSQTRASSSLSQGGALGRTRTPNLLIRSQMLYPLSYECRLFSCVSPGLPGDVFDSITVSEGLEPFCECATGHAGPGLSADRGGDGAGAQRCAGAAPGTGGCRRFSTPRRGRPRRRGRRRRCAARPRAG